MKNYVQAKIKSEFAIVGKVVSGHDSLLIISTRGIYGGGFQTLAVKNCKKTVVENMKLNQVVIIKGSVASRLKAIPDTTRKVHAQDLSAQEIIPVDTIQKALAEGSRNGLASYASLGGKVIYRKDEGTWVRFVIGGETANGRYQSVFFSAQSSIVPADLRTGDLIECLCSIKASKSNKVKGLTHQDLTAVTMKKVSPEDFKKASPDGSKQNAESQKSAEKKSEIREKPEKEKKKAVPTEAPVAPAVPDVSIEAITAFDADDEDEIF